MADDCAKIEVLTPVEIKVDKDDLLAAGMSKMERFLMVETRKATATVNKLQGERAEKVAQLNADLEKLVKVNDSKYEAVIKAFSGLKIKSDVSTCSHLGSVVSNLIQEQNGSSQTKTKSFEVEVTLHVYDRDDRRCPQSLSVDKFEVPIPASAKTAAKKITEIDGEIRKGEQEVADLKAKMRKLPQMERMLKGRLAEQRVALAKGGEALLREFLKDLEADAMLCLPGARE